MQAVSVVQKDVLLLVRIAINLVVLVERYRIVTKKMVLQPTVLPVNADQQNVLLLVRIVTNLLVFVVMYHHAVNKMVLQPTVLPVNADQLDALLILVLIVLNLRVHVVMDQRVVALMVQ